MHRAARETGGDLVERVETPVMFERAADEPDGIRLAWTRLESRFPSLSGRRFFGSYDVASGEYRACVQAREDDDPVALGLEAATLAGGAYLRIRLRGEPPAVYDLIEPTFAAMARAADVDETRPSIEFYRRHDEVDLLLPVMT